MLKTKKVNTLELNPLIMTSQMMKLLPWCCEGKGCAGWERGICESPLPWGRLQDCQGGDLDPRRVCGVSAEGWELPSPTSGGVLGARTKDRGHPSHSDMAGELKNTWYCVHGFQEFYVPFVSFIPRPPHVFACNIEKRGKDWVWGYTLLHVLSL